MEDEKHFSSSPARSLRSLHGSDGKTTLPTSPRVKAEPDDNQPHVYLKVEHVPEGGHLGRSPASSSRVKEDSADRDAEGDFRMRDRSPVQQLHIPSHSPHPAVGPLVKTPSTPISPAQSFRQMVPVESTAEIPKPPTAPYLPSFPKCESVRERLGKNYGKEVVTDFFTITSLLTGLVPTLTQLSKIESMEANRAHTAAEYVQISKAVRRALHELDLTTMDLRAAQSRREHAENHRKKAAAGFLDFDAEFSAAT